MDHADKTHPVQQQVNRRQAYSCFRSKKASQTSQKPHLMLIVPSDEEERQASAMENWFQACASDEPFSLELAGTKREQGFVLRASSKEQLILLSKQFSAQYPQAQLQRISPDTDPLFLHEREQAIVGEIAMTQKPWMPLKTFTGKILAEPGADPLAGILAAMEPLGSGQRLICQLALVRAPENWIAPNVRKSVEHPLQEERDTLIKSNQAPSYSREGLKTLVLISSLITAMTAYHLYITGNWLLLGLFGLGLLLSASGLLFWWIRHSRQDIYDMKMVSEKMARGAFYTSLRVIAIGPSTTSTQELQAHIQRLEVAYRQFTLASANSLYLKRCRSFRAETKEEMLLTQLEAAFPYQHPLIRLLHKNAPGPDIWNGLELSGAFHLPQAFTDLPLVRRVSVKNLLAPPELAHQIKHTTAPLAPALIGYSQHRNYRVPVYLPYDTLFNHKFLVARSRYGKSTLIQLLVSAAMQPVKGMTLQPGVFVIDPHKDLIDDILKFVPDHRAKDVELLDLTDPNYVVALNPLDASMGFSRDQAVANLMSCFERIWSDFWGPRMAYFLKAVCLLLYTLNQGKVQRGEAEKQYTILDINPLLQYPEYALKVLDELDLSKVWHQELFSWWQNVYFALPKQSSFRSEVIMPIISKIGLFQDNQLLKRIVGQPITKAPVQGAITEGKIVLCALSSRDMDDAAVNVMGSTLINLLHRAFSMQQSIPLKERRKVFCAVDEFHAFSGGDFDRLLSEDAKFGCSLLLATQNLRRLNKIRDGLLEMVFSNCENLFAFNVSAADAKLLEEELREQVEQKHIISQPRLHCYARLAIPENPLQIVSVNLAEPPSWRSSPGQEQRAQEIRRRNQQRNATADEIDHRYATHLAQFLDVAASAQPMQREVRAANKMKKQREDANQLAKEAGVMKLVPKDQHVASSTQIIESKPEQAKDLRDGTPAAIKSSLTGYSTAPASTGDMDKDGNAGKRNHQRSRRKKAAKNPVGTPPPLPQIKREDPTDQGNDVPRPRILISTMTRGGSFRERERRE